jgi:hypothetical protein
VQRVGREDRIEALGRPSTGYVEREWWRQVGQRRFVQPHAHTGQILLDIRCLPDRIRKGRREEHGVLAGAAADFEHSTPILKILPEHFQDRPLIALAGGRERFR